MTMQAIYDWIDANADECIKDLQTFVQQPSISAQNIGLRECATLIRDMMRQPTVRKVLPVIIILL
mgnify:FL=1